MNEAIVAIAARKATARPVVTSGSSRKAIQSLRSQGARSDGPLKNPVGGPGCKSQCFFFQFFHHLTVGPSIKRLSTNHKRRERDGHSVHRHDAGHGQSPLPMQCQALERPLDVLVRGVVPKGEVSQAGGFVHQYFFRHFVHARILRRIAGVEYSDFPRDQFIHAVIVRRSACNRIQAILYEVACP